MRKLSSCLCLVLILHFAIHHANCFSCPPSATAAETWVCSQYNLISCSDVGNCICEPHDQRAANLTSFQGPMSTAFSEAVMLCNAQSHCVGFDAHVKGTDSDSPVWINFRATCESTPVPASWENGHQPHAWGNGTGWRVYLKPVPAVVTVESGGTLRVRAGGALNIGGN